MFTFTIEASSVEELADKLLAVGSRLQGGQTVAPVEAAPAKSRKKVPEGNAAASSAEAPSPTSNSAPNTPSADAAPCPSEPASLDWDKDVAPAVLAVVKDKGREFVTSVLEQFGVTRAAQLPPERWQELLDALTNA